eukprot:SAG25_NODE_4_length_30349_cov_110.018280_28_plen_95_part_00
MLSSLVCQLQASLIHGGLRQAHHRIGAHLRHDDGAHVRKPREAARTQEGGGVLKVHGSRGSEGCSRLPLGHCRGLTHLIEQPHKVTECLGLCGL